MSYRILILFISIRFSTFMVLSDSTSNSSSSEQDYLAEYDVISDDRLNENSQEYDEEGALMLKNLFNEDAMQEKYSLPGELEEKYNQYPKGEYFPQDSSQETDSSELKISSKFSFLSKTPFLVVPLPCLKVFCGKCKSPALSPTTLLPQQPNSTSDSSLTTVVRRKKTRTLTQPSIVTKESSTMTLESPLKVKTPQQPSITATTEKPPTNTIIRKSSIRTTTRKASLTTTTEKPSLTTLIEKPSTTTTEKPSITITTEKLSITTTTEKPLITTTTKKPSIRTKTRKPSVRTKSRKPSGRTTTQNPSVRITTQKPSVRTTTQKPSMVTTTQMPPVRTKTRQPRIKTSQQSSITTIRPQPTTTTEPQNYITTLPPDNSTNYEEEIIKFLIVTFTIHDNILFFFGCLLQRPINVFTEYQYTTLHTLFIEFRNNPSVMQYLIPHLTKLSKLDLNSQLTKIMQIFSKIGHPSLNCAANLWVAELKQKRFDLQSLFTCSNNFNILQGVNVDVMHTKVMKPFDVPTAVTKQVLGPLFVKILYDIQNYNIVFTQKLFGIILAHFPLIPYNPVLDENIRYILDVTGSNQIETWTDLKIDPFTVEPYTFFQNIIIQILKFPNVAQPIKVALSYIFIHLIPLPSTYINPNYAIIQKINEHEPNIELLLSLYIPSDCNREAMCLKKNLLGHVKQGQIPGNWMMSERDGRRYTNPEDLFLGFLVKLQKNIPNQDNDIVKTVTALLSTLIIEKQNSQFSPVNQNIEIFTVLGYYNNPNFGSRINEIYDKAVNALMNKPKLQMTLTNLIPLELGQCLNSQVCMKEILSKLDQMNVKIPLEMQTIINEVRNIIPLNLINSKCKNPSEMFPMMPSVQYVDRPTLNKIDEFDNINHTMNNLKIFEHQVSIGEANLENVMILPPMLHVNQEMAIYINNEGAPVVDSPNIPSYPGNPKVTMPSFKNILKPPETSDPFGPMNPSFKKEILQPLIKISGSSDLTLFLGTKVKYLIKRAKCPTTFALIFTLLERAKSNSLVQKNKHLLNSIHNFLYGMNILSVMSLPIIMMAFNINPKNDMVFSAIKLSGSYKNIFSATPILDIPRGMSVFPILDPNKLKESIDPEDPYNGLFPDVDPSIPGGEIILHLRKFINTKRIQQLLPGLKPHGYMTKGFLLMDVLQKLLTVPAINRRTNLNEIIVGYIRAILIPSFFTRVSYTEVLKIIDGQPDIKPDTSYLLELLPPAKNKKEKQRLIIIKKLLLREDLFDILLIPKPTSHTNRMELLKLIIKGCLQSKNQFDSSTIKACKYLNSKVFDLRKGSLPIAWEMNEVKVTTFKVDLGKLVESVIPYSKLTRKLKTSYNHLLEYLRKNSNIFKLINDFPYRNYRTQGTFTKGLFNFLQNNSLISKAAKMDIKVLLPKVALKGSGAKLMADPGRLSGRRTNTQLEIII